MIPDLDKQAHANSNNINIKIFWENNYAKLCYN